MCDCGGKFGCTQNGNVCGPGRTGDQGPANNITMSVEALPAGSTPQVVSTGVSPNQHFNVGFPLSPLPVFSAQAQEGPLEVVVSGSPEAPLLEFTIPAGQNGANGLSRYTTLAGPFIQPARGSTVVINVGTSVWAAVGDWVRVRGGGWYLVDGILSLTSIVLRNPNEDQLTAYWGTPPAELPWNNHWWIPVNALPGIAVPPDNTINQVGEAGIPGVRGEQGAAGQNVIVVVTDDPPSLPPVDDAHSFVIYANALAPDRATVVIPYTWNRTTLAWDAGPNIAGAPGVQVFFQSLDPNITPIPTSQIGDVNFRVLPSGVTIERKATASTWTVQAVIPYGLTTQEITFAGPGPTVTLDLAYGAFNVQASVSAKLDWDNTNYQGAGNWTVTYTNTSGGSINMTFESGRWEEDSSLTLPMTIAIASGDTLIMHFVKNAYSGLRTITHCFVPSPLGS